MNRFYDDISAVEALQAYVNKCDVSQCREALHAYPSRRFNETVVAQHRGLPKSWILVKNEDVSQEDQQEMVFRIRGVISGKILPPFFGTPKRISQIRQLKQKIELTGLGLPYFDQAIQNLLCAYTMFERFIPEHQLERWEPGTSRYGESISVGNRVVTSTSFLEGLEILPFLREWDPNRYIERAIGDQFVFTDENMVQFYKRKDDESIVKESPVKFRDGDIVEVQITPTVIPIGGGKYKMLLVLRSVLLLDDSFAKSASFIQHTEAKFARKRKVGYEGETGRKDTLL